MRYSIRQLLVRAVTLASVMTAPLAPTSPVLAAGGSVVPDRMEPTTPKFRKDTENVGITEHLGSAIPLDLPFTDSTGRPARLSDYFKPGRPVILQLGYFNCPQLCDVVSRNLMDGVKGLPMQMGTDYSMLYVSIDPEEEWELGQSKKRTYVAEYGKPGAVEGWNFLVGKNTSIKPLADAVGFGYKKVEGSDDFSHPPMIVILSGEGKISRYIYGFQYPTATLETGIKEAREGKVGPYVQQILVALCYHYDEYSGKYSLAYMRLMQVGAGFSALVVFAWLGSRWIRDARAAKRFGPRSSPVTHS